MLKAVVEDVHAPATGVIFSLSQNARVVPFWRDIDRNLGFACNQDRLIAKLSGSSTGADPARIATLTTIATRQNVHEKAVALQQSCERNGERRLSSPSSRE